MHVTLWACVCAPPHACRLPRRAVATVDTHHFLHTTLVRPKGLVNSKERRVRTESGLVHKGLVVEHSFLIDSPRVWGTSTWGLSPLKNTERDVGCSSGGCIYFEFVQRAPHATIQLLQHIERSHVGCPKHTRIDKSAY